ncbi:MAG: response regulator receiver protein [Rhizobium sp.]|nr:response regulator receiver protein [Rhizobium sp.]
MVDLPDKRGPKMLIADDDPGIVRFLAARCVKLGFEVQTACNGLQALSRANRFHPDVLIIDINMPEADGLSVTSRLLSQHKWRLDVIVITASSYVETAGRCESFGVFHVRKGLDLWQGVRSALAEIFPDLVGETEDPQPMTSAEMRLHPRVLLIDDDPSLGTFLTSRLRKLGVELVVAGDGVQALKYANTQDPAVIITNYAMPNCDAYYLLDKLRRATVTDRIPVFILSEKALDGVVRSRLQPYTSEYQAPLHFFEKPLDIDMLFTELQEYCAFIVNPNPREDHLYPSAETTEAG